MDDIQFCNIYEIFYVYGLNDKQSIDLADALTIIGNERNFPYFQEIKKIHKNCEEAIDELNYNLQKEFRRPAGVERQQFEEIFNNKELRTSLEKILKEFFEPVHYGNNKKVKLILGASEETVKLRFSTVIKLEREAIHTDKIYLLGGQRDLWVDAEPVAKSLVVKRLVEKYNISEKDALFELEEAKNQFYAGEDSKENKRKAIVNHFVNNRNIIWPTESDMMMEESKKYSELMSVEFILIDSPKKLNIKGELERPDTLDTYIQFVNDYNISGDIGIVSSQPYILYQWQQARVAFIDKPINIYMSGEGVLDKEGVNFTVILDSVARFFYAGKPIVKKTFKNNINQEL